MTTILVTGSRKYSGDLAPYCDLLGQLAYQLFGDVPITMIHGGANGADDIAGQEGTKRGWTVVSHPADWDTYRKRAGPIRNGTLVAQCPHLALAVLAANSIGTPGCLKKLAKSTSNVSSRLAYVLLIDADNGSSRWLTPSQLYDEFA